MKRERARRFTDAERRAADELIRTFDAIQQKHHPLSVVGTRAAFEFPISLDDDEWEEP